MTCSNPQSPTKAIILSAGQGRRLLPLTENRPKCLLPIAGKSLLEWQVDNLLAAGVAEVIVVTGFGTALVEDLLHRRYGGEARVGTLYNPFYHVSDNLASCWIARETMDTDFLLLNGDTIFEASLLQGVLAAPAAPITLTVDHKEHYDEDDMKVEMEDNALRVRHVSKTIPAARIHAESIGLIAFRGDGPRLFREAVEAALREPAGLKSWYLAVIDELAADGVVTACAIDGRRWAEIDFMDDLAAAESLFTGAAGGVEADARDTLQRNHA